MRPLEQILADGFAEADVLDRNGASFSVERVRQLLRDIRESAEPYITWLNERDAAIRAGRSEEWMRAQFPAMQRDDNAKLSGRARQYRQCAVPQRAQTAAAAARAREAARMEKRSA